MSSMAFIEPVPVIDLVAQILGKDVYSKPLSDADRVKVWMLSAICQPSNHYFQKESLVMLYSACPILTKAKAN